MMILISRAIGISAGIFWAFAAFISVPAFAFPDGISQFGTNAYKIATSSAVSFPRSGITETEKSAVRDARKFCAEQGHPEVFVMSFATPTDSRVTFQCGDAVSTVR
jgi:hypothetical protein